MLRPVIDYLHHKPASVQASTFLRELEATFRNAKLDLSIDDSGTASGLTNAFDRLLQRPTDVADALVELLSRAMFHTYTLTLPSGKQIILHVRTGTVGVEYKVFEKSNNAALKKCPKEDHFQSFETAKKHLQLIARHEVLSLIESSTESRVWHMSSPFSGELSMDRGFRHQAQILLLDLTDSGLLLRWDARENSKEADGKFIWSGAQGSAADQSQGIIDLVKNITDGFAIEQ